jgi:NAD(P)-dependent dehydrogenase (short-subunit alcohol dehydrogenase family)
MLKDKVAIITGVARVKGIGFGIAKKFAENGCHVVLNDIREPDQEVLNELKNWEKSGIKSQVVIANISSSKEVTKLVRETVNLFGKIDILVNNAAFAPRPKSILDISEEEWDKTLSVNLKGPFLLSKEVLTYMKKARYGKIINISAASGITPLITDAHYNSSKAALNMLTKDMALEFAPFNINVNCICPGIIVTELVESLVPKGMDKAAFFEAFSKNAAPMQRVGYPEDIGNATLFLASDSANYITGEVIVVGGGVPLFRATPPGAHQ